MYLERGKTLEQIGDHYGVDRRVVSSVFRQHQIFAPKRGEKIGEQATERFERTISTVFANPGISWEALADAVGLSEQTVRTYVLGHPAVALIGRDGSANSDPTFSEKDLIRALKDVARGLTAKERAKGLSQKRYDELRSKTQPSGVLFVLRFGRWSTACKNAGVAPSASHTNTREYTLTWTDEQLITSIGEYLYLCANDRVRPTNGGYTYWANGQLGAPSVATIRARFGSWTNALQIAQTTPSVYAPIVDAFDGPN
jgi:hypothetical protein